MLRRAGLTAFVFVLLTGCGGSIQGPPDFRQVYSVVDQPCALSQVVSHCTVHVLVVNRGGEGIGHANVLVPMQPSAASGARTVSTAKCGRSIPDTPAGGSVDLTCDFDLAAGKTVSGYPSLDIDFTAAAASGSSAGGFSGLGAFGLALVAALLSAVALVMAITGQRGRPTSTSKPAKTRAGDDDNW